MFFQKNETIYTGPSVSPQPARATIGRRVARDQRSGGLGWLVTNGRPPAAAECPNLSMCKFFFIPPAVILLRMWSTPASWL
jgi:hypothetical protein